MLGIARRRSRSSRLLAVVPQLSLDTHGVFSRSSNSPGTLQLLGLCSSSAASRSPTTCCSASPACSRSGTRSTSRVGVYLTAIATTQWDWSLPAALALTARRRRSSCRSCSGSVSLRVGGIAFAMVTLAFAEAGSILVDKNPRGWTGGEEGVAGQLRRAARGVRRRAQHEEPLLARARLPGRRLRDRQLGGRLVARPRLAGDPRERAARRGARAAAVPVQADGVRPLVVPRHGRRRRLRAPDRRRHARRSRRRPSRWRCC